MSLFRARGPEPATPADRPVTRLTVRLPKELPEARVVAVHAGYGEEVGQGTVVVTLRVGEARRVVKAPRAGRLLPMAGPGDELVAGDALFTLHVAGGAAETASGGEVSVDAPVATAPAAAPGVDPAVPRADPADRAAERRPRQARERERGRHVPVLGAAPAGTPSRARAVTPTQSAAAGDAGGLREKVAPRREPAPPPAAAAVAPATVAGLVRVGLALALFAAALAFLLPLLVEFGFGSSAGARLAITLAALALGLLAWLLLARGAGRLAAIGVGLFGALWTALVVLTLIGVNPLPFEPVSLPDTHALAPASRTRVPPARPAAVPPGAFSGIRSESSAGAPPPEIAEPAERVSFSAIPTERFALVPAPDAPPPVEARTSLERPRAPETRAAGVDPAPGGAPVHPGADAPRPAPPAGAPEGLTDRQVADITARPPRPTPARALAEWTPERAAETTPAAATSAGPPAISGAGALASAEPPPTRGPRPDRPPRPRAGTILLGVEPASPPPDASPPIRSWDDAPPAISAGLVAIGSPPQPPALPSSPDRDAEPGLPTAPF